MKHLLHITVGLSLVLLCSCSSSRDVEQMLDKAEELMRRYVPQDLTEPLAGISDVAKIHHRLDVMAFVMEALVRNGLLTVPKEPTNLTVFGVRK